MRSFPIIFFASSPFTFHSLDNIDSGADDGAFKTPSLRYISTTTILLAVPAPLHLRPTISRLVSIAAVRFNDSYSPPYPAECSSKSFDYCHSDFLPCSSIASSALQPSSFFVLEPRPAILSARGRPPHKSKILSSASTPRLPIDDISESMLSKHPKNTLREVAVRLAPISATNPASLATFLSLVKIDICFFHNLAEAAVEPVDIRSHCHQPSTYHQLGRGTSDRRTTCLQDLWPRSNFCTPAPSLIHVLLRICLLSTQVPTTQCP